MGYRSRYHLPARQTCPETPHETKGYSIRWGADARAYSYPTRSVAEDRDKAATVSQPLCSYKDRTPAVHAISFRVLL